MFGNFRSFRILGPHMLNDRTELINDRDKGVYTIDIRSVEGSHVVSDIFDEILLIVAFRNYRELGRMNDFIFNGNIDSEWRVI